MTDSNYLKKNIFIIPVGEYFELGKDEVYIVYSPFANRMFFADKKGLEDITLSQLAPLIVKEDTKRYFSNVRTISDIQKMAIIPNHRCNFSCSYCYSAKGRNGEILDINKLRMGLNYFINPNRLKDRHISISFIGGGEPLLSWGIVKYGIEYATELASRYNFKLRMTLITNGSIINNDIVETLKQYKVLPDVSFDIIEDAQNKNRQNFAKVCKTIDTLCQNELTPSINATITPDTVERMDEMVLFMAKRFPKIQNMVFEPVVSNKIFSTTTQLHDFYQKYLTGFAVAKQIASNEGRNVTCRIYKNIDSLLERGCPSKFTLTPQGDISICYCISSPNEEKFNERTYGRITTNTVELDEKKFNTIHKIDVHSFAKCDDCFAKWHCGGGCMCPNDTYNIDYLKEVCIFTRNMVKQTLIERANKKCKEKYGKELKDVYRFGNV